MAGFFSWLKRSDEDYSQFEQVLAGLESKIRDEKASLEQDRLTSKGRLFYWYYYNVPISIIVSLVLVQLSRTVWSNEHWKPWLQGLAPVALYPFAIYVGGRVIQGYYRKKITRKEKHLEKLKAKQKLKLEELKKKTGYYVTKGILERYEEEKALADEVNAAVDPTTESYGQYNEQDGLDEALPEDFSAEEFPNANAFEQFDNETLDPRRFSNSEMSNHRIISLPKKEYKMHTNAPDVPSTTPRKNAYDRVIDWIVGDVESPTQTYALICEECHAHCGLALPELFFTMEYYCPYCSHFNSNLNSLKSPLTLAPSGRAPLIKSVSVPSVEPPVPSGGQTLDSPLSVVSSPKSSVSKAKKASIGSPEPSPTLPLSPESSLKKRTRQRKSSNGENGKD